MDRANDEERDNAAVPIEGLRRAPRHGSSQSLGGVTRMGQLVKLWKAEETETRVVYSYGPSQEQRGRIACTKADGAISLVESVPGIPEQDDRFFYRDLAMVRLRKLHSSGEFPDEAFMAT